MRIEPPREDFGNSDSDSVKLQDVQGEADDGAFEGSANPRNPRCFGTYS